MHVALLALALALPEVLPVEVGRRAEILTPWRTLEAHRARVRCLAFDSKGRLVSGSADGRVCLWSAEAEELRRVDLPRPGG